MTRITAFPWRPLDKQSMQAADSKPDAGVLFQAYHERIFRYLLRMLKNRAEAEDLTQETFLRAHRHQQTLRDAAAVRGWLYRIATHACLDRLRQRKAPVSMDSDESAAPARSTVSPQPSGLEVAEREETSLCVQRCLDYLPDSYRSIILLYEAHGLTAPEIADLLGLKLTLVKMRLHRARRSLQKIMECGCAVARNERGVPFCEPRPRSRS